MKRPSQLVSFNIPTSGQIRSMAWHYEVTQDFISKTFPPELLSLASQIIQLSKQLQATCDKYDLQWLHSKQSLIGLMRNENARLVELERKRKAEKESQKIRKQEISRLSKTEKRYVKITGKTPKEALEEFQIAFQKFMEAQVSELPEVEQE